MHGSSTTDPRGARVTALYAYPVKALSPQLLDHVTLRPGQGFPLDRVYALARPDGAYREGMTTSLQKYEYFVLAREARLAGLETHLADDGVTFTVRVKGRLILRCDLTRAPGRAAVEALFARVLDMPSGRTPILAAAGARRFTDTAATSDELMNSVSLINVASVRAFGEAVGAEVDPLRFRANIYVDGLPSFKEQALIGAEFTLGGMRLRGLRSTVRCAATEVDPKDARRNIPVPRLLQQTYGHNVMGLYAAILDPGVLRPGAPVRVPDGDACQKEEGFRV
jgi:MOSC domain-containing protein